MQIPVKEVERGMIIDDGHHEAVIGEAWSDQGVGLGVVLKGLVVGSGTRYFRRFLNPDLMIDVKGRNML